MLIKVWLSRATNVQDAVLSAFQAARMQIALREARAIPQLAVVHVPTENPYLDTFVVSGDPRHVLGWIRRLVQMGVSEHNYAVEVPPTADAGNDWAEWLADQLDEPGVRFDCRISPDPER